MRIVRPSSLGFSALIALILGGGVALIGMQVPGGGPWVGLVPVVGVAYYALRRPLRRWRAVRRPLDEAARAWLADHVPLYQAAGEEARTRFERDVLIILDEWTFEGVDGAEVTPVLRLGVAAGAALLLHGRPDWELPPHHTVLFYPDRFDDDYRPGDRGAFDGMAHAQGPVILSVRAVHEDWSDPTDGHNVVLHELAHLLDYENAFADGTPALIAPDSTQAWRALVRREMRRVRHRQSILRSYAATNPAEFFAVAVENFFERPALMQRRHQHLFEALVAFFALDPRGHFEKETLT